MKTQSRNRKKNLLNLWNWLGPSEDIVGQKGGAQFRENTIWDR